MDPNEKGTNQCGGWFSRDAADRVRSSRDHLMNLLSGLKARWRISWGSLKNSPTAASPGISGILTSEAWAGRSISN